MVKYDKKGRRTSPQLKNQALNFRVEAARRNANPARTGSRFKPSTERKYSLKTYMNRFRGQGLENKASSANLGKINAWKRYFGGRK